MCNLILEMRMFDNKSVVCVGIVHTFMHHLHTRCMQLLRTVNKGSVLTSYKLKNKKSEKPRNSEEECTSPETCSL